MINLTRWRKINRVPTNKLLKLKTLQYINNKNWYKNTHIAIKTLFPDDYKLFSSLLAVTSQRNRIPINLNMAFKAFITIKEGNDPLNLDYGLCTPQIRGNIKRILEGNTPRGNKIKPFYGALNGDYNQIVIDTWMIKLFIHSKRKTPNLTDIRHIQTIINNLSKELLLKPCQIQACLWCYAKTELNDTMFKESYDYSFYLSKNHVSYSMRKIKNLEV